MIGHLSIESAAAHGSSTWIKDFIREYLPKLHDNSISGEEFAGQLDAQFEHRHLTTIKQQKNYRSNIVQSLKSIDPHHPAIILVALTAEQYSILNDEQEGITADRQTQFIEPANVDRTVNKAISLLDSDDYADIAAGLAVLIGRRIGEILLSEFAPNSAWTIDFGEMFKKKAGDEFTIEIPTLAPAPIVLSAIAKLQSLIDIDHIKRDNSISPKIAKQRVNASYSGRVVEACDLNYGGLIPPRTGKTTLYTHIFRAVYATIASHWFCPPQIPEHRYKAEIQGHLEIVNGVKRPKYNSRNNYDDYAIGDGNGNRNGRLGIKLGTLPNLQVLKEFTDKNPQEITPMQAATNVDNHQLPPSTIATPSTSQLSPLQAANLQKSKECKDSIERGYKAIVHLLTPETTNNHRMAMIKEWIAANSPAIPPSANTFRKYREIWHPDFNNENLAVLADEAIANDNLDSAIDQSELPTAAEIAGNNTAVIAHETSTVVIEAPPKQDSIARHTATSITELEQSSIVKPDPNITWFIGMVDELKAEIANLKYQNDVLNIAAISLADDATNERIVSKADPLEQAAFDRLVTENQHLSTENAQLLTQNDRLNQELAETKLRLDSIANMLAGNAALPASIPPNQQAIVSTTPLNSPTLTVSPSNPPLPSPPPTTIEEPHHISVPTSPKKVNWTPHTEASINRAIDAILKWNEDNTTDKLRASVELLSPLCRAMGAASRAAISAVLKSRAEELSLHYQTYKIGERDNRFVDLSVVLPVVARDYLKLDNWLDAVPRNN